MAHSVFLLSVYPKDKQTSMGSENLFLKIHIYQINYQAGNPTRLVRAVRHHLATTSGTSGFSGHEALKKNNVQVEILTKRKLGLSSNHPCPSGLRLFLSVFLELSRESDHILPPLATTCGITGLAGVSVAS